MTVKTVIPTELGTEKISKLLRQYAIPAIIAMTASSLYNMVDSIFIGHGVGTLAIAGLALTFPLMNLGAAFGSLVGVGASTSISVLLGQKNYDMARNVLGNVITLNTIICANTNSLTCFTRKSFFNPRVVKRIEILIRVWFLIFHYKLSLLKIYQYYHYLYLLLLWIDLNVLYFHHHLSN